MYRHSTCRLKKSGAHFLGPLLLFIPILSQDLSSHMLRAGAAQVLAIFKSSGSVIPHVSCRHCTGFGNFQIILAGSEVRSEHVVLQDRTGASVTIDYPEDGSIFPSEITPPTFIWHDGDASVSTWRIDISFADGTKRLRLRSHGDPMQIGEIEPTMHFQYE